MINWNKLPVFRKKVLLSLFIILPENEGDQNIGSTGSPGPVEHKESSSAQPRQGLNQIFVGYLAIYK